MLRLIQWGAQISILRSYPPLLVLMWVNDKVPSLPLQLGCMLQLSNLLGQLRLLTLANIENLCLCLIQSCRIWPLASLRSAPFDPPALTQLGAGGSSGTPHGILRHPRFPSRFRIENCLIHLLCHFPHVLNLDGRPIWPPEQVPEWLPFYVIHFI
jgi:hypothetical protein